MALNEEYFKKFKKALQEMLMLDQADLDFGIYRIMNQKRADIENYINNDLRKQVSKAISEHSSVASADLQKQLQETINQCSVLGVDPNTDPKVLELKAKIAASGSSEDLEAEVYNQLSIFFSRYYDGGDFISQRRYKKDVYAIPYQGEEVKLYWANADQYYIKTGEYFRNYRFALGGDKFCEFTLVDAETEQNNNKTQGDKVRCFALYHDEPIRIDGNTLHINFTYELMPKGTKQAELIARAFEEVEKLLPDDFRVELLLNKPTEKDPNRTLLQKHMNDYVARNTFDYFIHKDLEGFLSRELDFFIKNEVLEIDDVDAKSPNTFLNHLTVIKAIKVVGRQIITFLAQLENFQKKLWLKKKFVVQADYCITLDRVPESLYDEIAANEAQREEWVRLFAIDEIAADLQHQQAYTSPLTVAFLKENPFLVLDTAFFSADFKHKLLASIDNIDEQCNGLLINSENFQALELLREKYKEKVKCVYIDPPYNTGGDGFAYKDSYQHSSWLSMMKDRLESAWDELTVGGVIFISIDDYENSKLRSLCNQIFGEENNVAQLLWKGRGGRQDSKHYAVIHEYILCYAKKSEEFIAGVDYIQGGYYPKYDAQLDKHYKTQLLRKWGSNSRREDRPNLYYPIKGPNGEDIYPIIYDNALKLKILGRWRWSANTMAKAIDEGRIEFVKNEWNEYVPYERIYEPSGNDGSSKKYTTWIDSISNGTVTLKKMFRDSVFDYPKSPELVQLFVNMQGLEDDEIILDFFAGSGTTAHAVINLNREDDGNRKYILCEMAEYFTNVTKPRTAKVIYSSDWNDGKPVSRDGISQCFKYLRLEQYEDTLNNLVPKQEDLLTQTNEQFYGSYMLGYTLDVETRDSLFNLQWFRNPWNTQMKITQQNVTKEQNIDLVETFNYLIDLYVETMNYPRQNICVVTGRTRTGEKTLVIWRNVDEVSNEELEKFFEKMDFRTKDAEFDRIYVNGDNNLENLRTENESWKVMLIEEEFAKRMFEDC